MMSTVGAASELAPETSAAPVLGVRPPTGAAACFDWPELAGEVRSAGVPQGFQQGQQPAINRLHEIAEIPAHPWFVAAARDKSRLA